MGTEKASLKTITMVVLHRPNCVGVGWEREGRERRKRRERKRERERERKRERDSYWVQ